MGSHLNTEFMIAHSNEKLVGDHLLFNVVVHKRATLSQPSAEQPLPKSSYLQTGFYIETKIEPYMWPSSLMVESTSLEELLVLLKYAVRMENT